MSSNPDGCISERSFRRGEERARFAFVMEQTLGHVAHTKNLERALAETDWIDATVARLRFKPSHMVTRLPGVRNWSLRSSLMGRTALSRRLRQGRLDAAFIHTQVASLLSVGIMRSLPTVISLDATPIDFDEVGAAYGHHAGGAFIETLKLAANRRSLLAAAALVTWSQLAANSLTTHYGVPSGRIHVIPPGVDLERFQPAGGSRSPGAVRVLFVGGDFARKGGPDLLIAMAGLPNAELNVVTQSEVVPPPGVRCYVHRGLGPADPELLALYRQADIFALPSRGDCLPQALAEAAAVGLPLVATRVGAIGEIVRDGQNGYLVRTHSPADLRLAVARLVADPELRRAMGRKSLDLALREHDAMANNRRIFDLMADVACVRLAGAAPAT